MNIFGEGFPKEIQEQIKYRQKVYSSGYTNLRTESDITFLNSKTGFCRLVSGVDISSSKDINNPTINSLNLSGPELAKKFVLSNGISEYVSNGDNYSLIQREGVATQNNIFEQSAAYGIGGTDFGLNPMMGIISADIKHENRGSLRRAVIKVKAFNKQQFEIIDALYLRLGFSVLLEWGHNIWLDDKGELVLNGDNSLIHPFLDAYGEKQIVTTTTEGGWGGAGGTWDDDTSSNTSNFNNIYNQALNDANQQFAAQDATATTGFKQQVAAQQAKNGDIRVPPTVTTTITKGPGKLNYDDILYLIHNQRLSSNGNYDAMLGKVANFSWTLNKDGSYDITINLSSIGDVIESLKINMLTSSPGSNNSTGNTATGSFEDVIDSLAYNSTISNFLWLCKNNLFNLNQTQGEGGIYASSIYGLNPSNNSFGFNFNIFDVNQDDLIMIKFEDGIDFWGSISNLSLTYKYDNGYYIRLGTFLRFIQNYAVAKTYTLDKEPGRLLNIDDDIDTNIMLSHPLQISSDPRICFVNKNVSYFSIERAKNDEAVFGLRNPKNPFTNEKITNDVGAKHNLEYANIMNIYLELGFILKTMFSLQDDKGNLSYIDFLKGLLRGINEGLGGINDLDVFIDETNNQVKIIDKNPLPFENDIIKNLNQNFPTKVRLYNNFKPLNENLTELQLYGYSNNQAGFISDFSLTTELSPQFSTMITVGSAARGSVVGENDTALSRLNYGFEDRFKHYITNSPSLVNSNTDPYSLADYNARVAEYENIRKDYNSFLFKLSNGSKEFALRPISVETKDSDAKKVMLSSLLQKANEIDDIWNNLYPDKKITLNYNGAGFIPFNLGLTMDGLSGIKINQQFLLNTNFLPTNYPETMKFLIKNLSHEIKNNKWTTKIETYTVPKYMSIGDNKSILFRNNETTTQEDSTPPATKVPTREFDNYLDHLKFVYPITGIVSSQVKPGRTINGKTRDHQGTDIAAKVGTQVYSACKGVVVRIGGSGYGSDSAGGYPASNNSLLIKVDPSCYKDPNQQPTYIWYGHLAQRYKGTDIGSSIEQGQLIGISGTKGTGPHLHFEIYIGTPGSKQIIIDPKKYSLDEGSSVQAKAIFREKNTPGRAKQGGLD